VEKVQAQVELGLFWFADTIQAHRQIMPLELRQHFLLQTQIMQFITA
jgi:hypothetical protein